MEIIHITFDEYPYKATGVSHIIDGKCPVKGVVDVPKGLETRSAVLKYFKKNIPNFKVEISHTPFPGDELDIIIQRVCLGDDWYRDKAGKCVYCQTTQVDGPTEIIDDRTYD